MLTVRRLAAALAAAIAIVAPLTAAAPDQHPTHPATVVAEDTAPDPRDNIEWP